MSGDVTVRIVAMLASSIDGRIADYKGCWVPLCPYDEIRFEDALSAADAVVVGWRTVAHSGLSFIPRDSRKKPPLRVVIDPRGVLPPSHPFYASRGGGVLVFGYAGLFDEKRRRELEEQGARVVLYERYPIDASSIARLLVREYGVREILVAGGGTTAWYFLRDFDNVELRVTFVPVVLGDSPYAVVKAPPLTYPGLRLTLVHAEVCRCGGEIVAKYVRRPGSTQKAPYLNV